MFNSLKITSAQAKKIEALTRDQAGSKHWFRYRAGRVTASKFKAAARTNLAHLEEEEEEEEEEDGEEIVNLADSRMDCLRGWLATLSVCIYTAIMFVMVIFMLGNLLILNST